jgi:hypothetical protein
VNTVIFVLGFLVISIGLILFLILGAISIFKKNGKAKINFAISGGFLIGFVVYALAAPMVSPGESEPVVGKEVKVEKKSEEKTQGPSQEELNEKLKQEAVQANFTELDGDNQQIGKKVYIDGEVGPGMKDVIDEFMLTAKEGDGYGIYKVKLFNTAKTEYNKGDQVRVYGTVEGKDDSGMPLITATILEKK